MIDHKRKFIFLHIPKCAGTSIGNLIINEFKYNKKELPLFKDFNYFYYDSYRIHYDNLNKHILKNYFVFTIVRNPYNRFVSEYKYNEELDIDDFDYYCENFEKIWDKKYHKIEKLNDVPNKNYIEIANNFYNNIHRISQTNFLNGSYTDYLDKTKYINKIIKFENLSNEIKFIYSKLGIKNFKIEHHNSSNIKKFEHKKVNLSKKNKEIIYNIYKEDFSNFGYLP